MAYLLLDGPLDLTGDERGFLTALWRHDRRQEWPTDEQWALRFDVDGRTVRRWRSQLIEASMIKFDRPWNIPGAAGGWKGPRKDHGVYTLLPPTQWRYRNGWRYAGAHVGWVDGDGVVVEAAPSVTRESAPSRLGLPGASHEGQSAPASALGFCTG